MSTDATTLSIKKNQLPKNERKPLQFGSNSSRSDRYVSASKSNKAFEDSLRKSELLSNKAESFNSPLKKKLLFGKNQQDKQKQNRELFIIDVSKKIKKIESPFRQSQSTYQSQQKLQQLSETNMLVSSFDSISQKLQDQAESSISIEKIVPESEELNFKSLALEIDKEFNDCKIENEKIIQNEIQNESEIKNNQSKCFQNKDGFIMQSLVQMISQQSLQKSSMNDSLKSKSSETIRMKKKEKKIKKKKEKQLMVKSMKEKLKNITNFVNDLHKRQVHTDRKELIDELRHHLSEEKFVRLRNELKRLI